MAFIYISVYKLYDKTSAPVYPDRSVDYVDFSSEDLTRTTLLIDNREYSLKRIYPEDEWGWPYYSLYPDQTQIWFPARYASFSGDVYLSDCTSCLSGLSNLERVWGLSNLNLSGVESTSEFFSYCSSLESLDLSGLDVSNISDFSGLFCGCSSLETIRGLDTFDTSAATSMDYMFCDCSKLVELNLSSFTTSGVEDFSYMFSGCCSLRDIQGLDAFDVSKAGGMWDGLLGMFDGCPAELPDWFHE